MDISVREMSYDSVNGKDRIFVRVWEPAEKSDVRGVVQIAHGMAEHSKRYEDFGKFLASYGFSVCANDHLGHGYTVPEGGVYGYFGENGYRVLVDDMQKLHGLMRKEYPNVPTILFGHSMGSFLARSYTSIYGDDLSAAVFSGTASSKGGLVMGVGRVLANNIVKKKGGTSMSAALAKMASGDFNKTFQPARTEFDWLTRDSAIVDQYVADPMCGFMFTAAGYRDLICLLSDINKPAWFKSVPNIPILLIAGDRDPVGDFTKGVRKVSKGLSKTGHSVEAHYYPDARHEVLNEVSKHEVYTDVLNFAQMTLGNEDSKEKV